MKIIINDKICGEQNLINYIETKLESPYENDNWDGFRDCLLDLSWMSDTTIEIIHDSLPELTRKDLSIYIDILYESSRIWKLSNKIDFSFSFPDEQKQIVYDIIQADNLVLPNRMRNKPLYQIKFGYGNGHRLLKAYFLFDTFCFSVDKDLRIDYYSLTVNQMTDLLGGRFSIHENDDEEIEYVKTLKEEVAAWHFLDCKLLADEEGRRYCRLRFKDLLKIVEIKI